MNKYLSYLNNYAKFDKIFFQRFFDINYYSKNNFISWFKISQCGKLYDNFIDKFADKIYFVILPKYQEISQYILNKYQNKFDKNILNVYSNEKLLLEIQEIPLSETFINKNINKLEIKRILQNKLDEKFIEDLIEKLSINKKIEYNCGTINFH